MVGWRLETALHGRGSGGANTLLLPSNTEQICEADAACSRRNPVRGQIFTLTHKTSLRMGDRRSIQSSIVMKFGDLNV